MRMVDLIEKKRDGGTLTQDEINFIISGYVKGEIPDYQISAWAMTVFFRGMNKDEIAELTQAMVDSGEKLDLSAVGGRFVDKHSTGGVGDKTTLLVSPMVAACGVPIAKMSGRGLGHTGGTIDKLSSIPGFKVELERKEFLAQVKHTGLSVIAQTGNMVPADKLLYALRDVTATVNSIPLIASSVMSKKIAAGAQGIVLDVKYGSGAFMESLDEARRLAETMVEIGKSLGRKTVAVLSSMDQPLGRAVGNSLEVLEVLDALQGEGPDDLVELCLELGSWMLVAGQRVQDTKEARKLLQGTLLSGAAWEKFREFVVAQGGDVKALEDRKLPLASRRIPLLAQERGYIHTIDARKIGHLAMILGAGRLTKESPIDLGAGVILLKKQGDWVEPGEPVIELYTNLPDKEKEGAQLVAEAIKVSLEEPRPVALIEEVIS
jgi:pyrimidine-nucleoside phosphorylase